ncbi:2Fe-2S iron-sulfur cluster-binding protein [Bradyrhizobium sp. S69]|uniref:2Fe-2S iron-sulfur cluster-binding protein n=1 Tax=Bradyrhizobium sp. S69 TaxID=1641856 RepID=UPI00131B3C07|nr:2Fe-2S iron-sulfur cluster-binding protein [Bradyrhizobium sp. S69]
MIFQVAIDDSVIAFGCEAGETVLDAAERAGYSLPYSCRKGICSTCEAGLRHGQVAVGAQQMAAPTNGVLLCQARPQTDIVIRPKRIDRHDPTARKRITASVYRVTRPAEDVFTLMLRFPAGIRARFKAGQYLRVSMPDGDTRNFSMANAPRESDGVHLHIRRIPGGQFSEGVLARLTKGDKLRIEIPYGEFYLRTGSDKPIVCLATGTGFAPIKSIIEDLIARGNTRRVRLYWGGRRRQDLYLLDLTDKWAARVPWLTFRPVLSELDADWNGAAGLVHQAVLRDIPDLSGWQVYACGNPAMIRNAERDFQALGGLPDGQFFADPFVPSGNPQAAANATSSK